MFHWVLNTRTSEVDDKDTKATSSWAFIVDFKQIFFIGFHAYLTYFTNSCFHCFEQVNTIWKRFQKLKKINDIMHFSNVPVGKVLL